MIVRCVSAHPYAFTAGTMSRIDAVSGRDTPGERHATSAGDRSLGPTCFGRLTVQTNHFPSHRRAQECTVERAREEDEKRKRRRKWEDGAEFRRDARETNFRQTVARKDCVETGVGTRRAWPSSRETSAVVFNKKRGRKRKRTLALFISPARSSRFLPLVY